MHKVSSTKRKIGLYLLGDGDGSTVRLKTFGWRLFKIAKLTKTPKSMEINILNRTIRFSIAVIPRWQKTRLLPSVSTYWRSGKVLGVRNRVSIFFFGIRDDGFFKMENEGTGKRVCVRGVAVLTCSSLVSLRAFYSHILVQQVRYSSVG